MLLRLYCLSIIVILLIGCDSKQMNRNREKAFWDWFQANEDRLYHFERDQEATFDLLHAQLRKVDENLVFEFGPIENGRREFVISADGIRKAFPEVESLYAAAPPLPHWKIVKFRQRREPAGIAVGELQIDSDAVAFDLQSRGAMVDVTLYLPGYSPSTPEQYQRIALLFLDQALGEYDVETKVGDIDLKPRDEASPHALSLAQLPAAFDKLVKPH